MSGVTSGPRTGMEADMAGESSRSDGPDGVRGRKARNVTLAGLVLNVVLTAFKFVAGVLGHSQAVVADGVHSLSDMATDVMVLVGMRYWSAPADEMHPYGHRRVETIVTWFLGLSLAGVGIGLVYQAMVTLKEEHAEPPGWIAFAAAALAVVTKEMLYRWTVGVGVRMKSPAVVANAWHHRSDGLSSIPAALAVAGAAIEPSWYFLDHVGTVVVGVFILQAAWRVMAPATRELVDVAAPEESVDKIRSVALSVDRVRLVHWIRTRRVGSGLQVDLHVKVDPELTVREGHAISERVKDRLVADGPDVLDVVVHLEPYEEDAT